MNRSKLINVVGIAIGITGIAFVVRRVVRDRSEIADALSSANLVWLVVGGITGVVAMALIGVNWLLILRHTGAAAPWRRGMSWFFVGQLGKYVPGGIWPIVGQAELAHRGATPRGAAYFSTAMSMVATFLGAATVAALTGLISHHSNTSQVRHGAPLRYAVAGRAGSWHRGPQRLEGAVADHDGGGSGVADPQAANRVVLPEPVGAPAQDRSGAVRGDHRIAHIKELRPV